MNLPDWFASAVEHGGIGFVVGWLLVIGGFLVGEAIHEDPADENGHEPH